MTRHQPRKAPTGRGAAYEQPARQTLENRIHPEDSVPIIYVKAGAAPVRDVFAIRQPSGGATSIMGIGRSPRKLLKASLDSLDRLAELLDRYPEANAELESRIGAGGIAEIADARANIRRTVDILDLASSKGEGSNGA